MPLAELSGQELARQRLLHLAASGRVPPGLLFVGPQGVGKRLAARAFVQALNCKSGSGGDACGRCPTCVQIARNSFPDLLIVEPDGAQIKIEQVRRIQEFVSFAPLVGVRRVVVIEEAHRLNLSAANALLKTLEEPSVAVSFILLSHRHNLLPETVLSRCLQLPFVFLRVDDIARILAARESDRDAAAKVDYREAAIWSGGSMERAGFFLKPENLTWGREFVAAFAALPGSSPVAALDLAEACAGCEDREMLFYLMSCFLHDALLVSREAAGDDISAARAWSDRLDAFAAVGSEGLRRWQERLLAIEDGFYININLRIALEALFLEISAAG
jgi:DNA polymerase-3 subunit delta'